MMKLGLVNRPPMRTALAGLVTALAAGGVAVFGLDSGHAAQNVRLVSGAAWMASPKVGQVSLLDGSSAEVAAQVQVAPAGNVIDVVQSGSAGYTVDQTAGTVRRIDPATFEPSQPESPIPDARGGLVAFPGKESVYLLDTRRGVVANADPKTLTRRGDPVSLAAELNAGSATLDGSDRLWAIDNATGDLSVVNGASRVTHRGTARPGRSILAVANGNPVIVDTTERKAITLDPDSGKVESRIDLDLRQGDEVAVSGSAHSARLYVVASRGALTICELAAQNCDSAVPLAENSRLGAAVEAGNRLFVPDFSSGQVWIIDLSERKVVARPQVLGNPGLFHLLTRDGVVFFNDPNSERAGVIRLDGSVVPAAKYDPKDPKKGLTTPSTEDVPPAPNQPQQPDPNDPSQPNPNQPQPNPNQPPPDPNQPPNPNQPLPNPNQPPPNPPQPNPNEPPPNPEPQPNDPKPPPPKPTLKITLSKTNPMVGEDISLQVGADNGTPVTATWNFGDGQTGAGLTVTHQWATAKTYQVSVQATMQDAQQASTSLSVTVSAKPTAKLTVTPPANGRITGGGINCPGTCAVTVDQGTAVTLTEQPGPYYVFAGWGGACAPAGTAATCALTMDANKTVSARFNDTASPQDCVSHDPNQLSLQDNGNGTFTLVDSGNHLMATLEGREDADNALSVARGFTQHCFNSRSDARRDWLMEYWQGGAGQAGPVSREDCLPYNPNNLSIVEVNDSNGRWYSLRDGSSWMEAFTEQADAVRGLREAAKHTRQCFIGRGNHQPDHRGYILQYWR